MKIFKIKHIEEEVPFDINELKKDLENYDWFDPTNDDDWNYHMDEEFMNGKYSLKELDEHRDEITKFMQERRKKELNNEIYYYLNNELEKLIIYDNNYKVTEEEIHNYITEWFEENVD